MLDVLLPFGGAPGTGVLKLLLDLFQVLLLLRMAATWLAPRSTHPLVTLLELLTEPVLKPLREVVPPVGRLDLSPAFAFLAADLLKWLLSRAALTF